MCGLGGQFFHEAIVPSEDDLFEMGSAMLYRGPDDSGIYRAKHIGLVHRRLSIRDLSEAARCPMANADGNIQVLLNGEIYNWRDLRVELEALGWAFGTRSDTEVVVKGYEAWGDGVFHRLHGMFAIAIWDATRSTLVLARDRFGEKPLYYSTSASGLTFASSIEAMVPLESDREIDPVAIACHLVHNFVPAPRTVWQGINVLPPAHMLRIAPGEGAKLDRYWDFPSGRSFLKGYRACYQAIEAAITDSVERCLDADVPVGVFLSGGVDSSLVAAIASRLQPGLPAFSVGFAEADFNEVPYARKVAERLGLALHVREVDLSDVLSCLPHLVVQYGQPFGDASCVPSFLLARHARERVKVCLSGDGGDESFGGYWRAQSAVYAARYAALLPIDVRRKLAPVLSAPLGTIGRRWQALNQLSLAAPGGGYTNSLSWYNSLGELAAPRLRAVVGSDLGSLRVGRALERSDVSALQRVLFDDFQIQLPDDYLTKVDVASMAASLEVRCPYLTKEVVETAWGLPDTMKLNWGRRKWLLKRIAANWVPAEVVFRQKMGFALPLKHWFRGALGRILNRLLQDSVAVSEGWIRRAPVVRLLDEQQRGGNHETRLWLVLWLELWFRLVVSRVPAADVRRLLQQGGISGTASQREY
jgi:asparagine synthase (glutamine-hydrolysing)